MKKYITIRRKKELKRLKIIALITIAITLSLGFLSHKVSNPTIVPDVQAKTSEKQLCDLDEVICEGETMPEIRNQSNKEYIRQIAEEHNFPWIDYLLRLANCESQYLKYEKFNRVENQTPVWAWIDGKKVITHYIKTVDRGIFQINDIFHPEVSDECTDDIRCATEWTMWRIKTGYQKEWMCDPLIQANPNYYK